MIGRWLKEIASPEARAALLMGRFCAFDTGNGPGWAQKHNAGCLLGIPARATGEWFGWSSRGEEIYCRFNAVCMKLEGRPREEYVAMMRNDFPKYDLFDPAKMCLAGAAKTGVLIRTRILAIEAERTLKTAPVSRETVVEVGQVGGFFWTCRAPPTCIFLKRGEYSVCARRRERRSHADSTLKLWGPIVAQPVPAERSAERRDSRGDERAPRFSRPTVRADIHP